VSLTEEAVWLQETWELRSLALPELTALECPGEGKELILTAGSRKVHLKFGSAEAAKGFYQAMEEGE
jgi:hypothetical protein